LGLIPWPKVDFAKFGPIERKEMGRIKKISGANLLRNAIMIPAVTNHDDADITELEAFRVLTSKENEKSGVKVTMLAFLIKACVAALQKFPQFNSSLDGDSLVYKQYWHIGFAADTPKIVLALQIRNLKPDDKLTATWVAETLRPSTTPLHSTRQPRWFSDSRQSRGGVQARRTVGPPSRANQRSAPSMPDCSSPTAPGKPSMRNSTRPSQ
jgi:hypothetical protein